jgi:dihydroorotase
MIKKAKEDGLQITCSVTPYHLALTEDALKKYNSMYKVNPPLRGEQDRQALIKGLKDGVIDCIASHHHPHEWDAKTKEFEYASSGIALQESTFSVVLDSVGSDVGIDRVIEALTMMPRDIFGLAQKGINVGDKACITIFTTESNTLLQNNDVQSKSRNNHFIGKELKGKVIGIINNNQIHFNK